jgi:hyperosmotically inducible protein
MRPACSRGRAASGTLIGASALLTALLLPACGATTAATKDDASISTHVKIALLNDPHVGALRLDAKTMNGVVTLSGTVHSQAEADAAIGAARRVPRAPQVASEMNIVP